MALVGELAVGAAKDVDDVVMFTVGTGIGERWPTLATSCAVEATPVSSAI